MKKIVLFVLWALLSTACSGTNSQVSPTGTYAPQAPATVPPIASAEDEVYSPGEPGSSWQADVETYYKTMVFIHGTAQLLTKLDIEGLSTNPAGFAPLVMIPGVMDDRVIAANALSVPSGIEDAWSKASTAEAGLTQALQDFLMTYAKEAFLQRVTTNETLAAEAVAEAEAVLAAQYGVSADEIAAANRAALTEMGETYQTFASYLAAGQTQGDDGSE